MSDPCEMEALVEARRDGRLGPREEASLARHLESCASCRELVEELARFGEWAQREDEPLDELEHHRARGQLLRAAVHGGARRAPRYGVVAAAILMSIALGVGSWFLFVRRPSDALKQAASTSSVPSRGERTVTVLEPDAGADYERRIEGAIDTVDLRDGGITFRVRHLGEGERFLVKTDDATIEVRGTIFRVEASAGRVRRVAVAEGRVEVRFATGTTVLSAGETWFPPVVTSRVDEPSRKPHHATAKPTTSAAPPPSAAASVAGPDESPLMKAEAALARGDNDAAIDVLRSAGSSTADDEDASFLLVVALDRAGRHGEAAAAARRYLSAFPSGFRRAEAEAIAGPR